MRAPDPDDLDGTLRPWLLEHVCPFWLERARDSEGGFFEELDADGAPIRNTRRTSLVQARLTYVFSHACVLSGDGAFAQAAEHGLSFLERCFLAPEHGWHRAASVNGQAIDPAFDCYDQAFVLFALAWCFRATGDQDAVRLAEKTYRFMEEYLADPRHGGFREEYLPGGSNKLPRRQNPHMHLLEALLALHDATGHAQWLERAAAIITLFKTRFIDPRTGALIEFFAEDFSPAPGETGALREPGHQFEWVWLLCEFRRAGGDRNMLEYAERLYQFGTRFGIEKDATLPRAAFDAVDEQGNIVAPTKLLWPQTEFIKACVARHEFLHDPEAWPAIRAHVALIAKHFLRPAGASWHNQLARDGTPIAPVTPARVLYHLFLAMAEVVRISQTSPA